VRVIIAKTASVQNVVFIVENKRFDIRGIFRYIDVIY